MSIPIPGAADFSDMTGTKESFIDTVVHQALVDVDEEGTEAAAGTAVVMKKGSMITEFRADHPFMFLIVDNATGSILFIGWVIDPTMQLRRTNRLLFRVASVVMGIRERGQHQPDRRGRIRWSVVIMTATQTRSAP